MSSKKQSFRDRVLRNKEKKESAASSYGYLNLPKNIKMFSPDPTSRYLLDFLQYEVTDSKHPDRDSEYGDAEPGTLWYKRPFKVHRNVGAGNDVVVCLQSFGKKCPICEYRAKMMKEGATKEESDALRPSNRVLYIVVPLDSKKHEAEPHIFDISHHNFEKLLWEELKENPDNGIFPDLEEGLTVKVRFEGATIGKSQPFAEATRIDFVERKDQYSEKILKKVPNLDEVLQQYSYEELERKLLEIDEEDEDKPSRKKKSNEDDDDQPPRKSRRRDDDDEDEKPSRKRKSDDEEEEEEDDTKSRRSSKKSKDDDDEEEDEKPTRRRKSNDDDEDEKPKKSSKKSKEDDDEEEEDDDSKSKCPHKHRFGIDTDKFDECDTCKVWKKCIDKKEGK